MRSLFFHFALYLLLGGTLAAPPNLQYPFGPESGAFRSADRHERSRSRKPRALTGRFLHITDLHPDPFYKEGASTDGDDVCHRGNGTAGYYGAERASCDSPLSLVNATFAWIDAHLRDEIDFVIWTGDSARHDNDERVPRSREQVVGLNEYAVTKFREVFGKGEDDDDDDPTDNLRLPIVPTFGNNDFLPHNIFFPGPNPWTRTYLDVWKSFIPEAQRHSFASGGWFFREVLPGRLAVFSLNSMYFFDHNSAVDGCASRHEPGYRQFEWLRVQLQFLRRRGMKAIISGHVAPARTDSKALWDETCWQKYALWMRQYRDVVVGSVWGHMDIDHFMLQDTDDIDIALLEGTSVAPQRQPLPANGRMTIQSSVDYLDDLRVQWKDLPTPPKDMDMNMDMDTDLDVSPQSAKKKNKKKKLAKYLAQIGGEFAERYSVSLVGPSIVPKYFPTLRVVSYNVSGLEDVDLRGEEHTDRPALFGSVDDVHEDENDDDESATKKKKKFKKPKGPSKSSVPGPAYSPQPLTWTGYRQLFANLTTLNPAVDVAASHASSPPFAYALEYDTRTDPVFDLPDLTVRSYLRLAQRVGRYEPPVDEDDTVAGESASESESDDGDDDDDDDVAEGATTKKKKTKKKKKEKEKEKDQKNRPWLTFFTRAFVGAKEVDESRFARGQSAHVAVAAAAAAVQDTAQDRVQWEL